jgi:lipid II:glycine glycyltransferase (peptidoglycan interpeptide bridge formation enzyme)
MRDMCRHINDACEERGVQSSIYYSTENNTVGEAALVAISELGEETFPGMFLSEPIKKGNVRRYRKGYNTTEKNKVATCAKLKHLIENRKLEVNSQSFISQLKTYIATGTSFAGKNEEPDDLVAAMLVAIRMVMQLQEWDPTVYETMHDYVNDEMELPLPIYISSF